MSAGKPPKALSSQCRAFLADLGEFALAAVPPAHAHTCHACRQHWLAARSLAGLLRHKPAVPEALRGQSAFDGIYEQVVEQALRRPVGVALQAALTPVSMPATETPPNDPLARQLLGTPSPAPAELWQRIRGDIRAEQGLQIRARRMRRAALALVAAATIVISLLAFDRHGTQLQVAIVFEDMTAAPQIDIMPISVLRSNLR